MSNTCLHSECRAYVGFRRKKSKTLCERGELIKVCGTSFRVRNSLEWASGVIVCKRNNFVKDHIHVSFLLGLSNIHDIWFRAFNEFWWAVSRYCYPIFQSSFKLQPWRTISLPWCHFMLPWPEGDSWDFMFRSKDALEHGYWLKS